MTPEFFRHYSQLLDVLRGYEQWEANLILSPEAWSMDQGTPFITDELWDELLALQVKRNAVLRDARPG